MPLTSYGDFTYTVNFPGSSGPVHVKQRVAETETRVVDSNVAVSNMACVTLIGGGVCPNAPVVPIPDSVVFDEQIEIEERVCGFPFEGDTTRNIAYIWGEILNTCAPTPCVNGGTWKAFGWPNGLVPRKIIAVQTPPRFYLGTLYPGGGVIRFRRDSGSQFDCDITSAPPIPPNVQLVDAAACRYFHRSGTSDTCNAIDAGSNSSCRFGAGLYNYYPSGANRFPTVRCQPSGCCCQSELQIDFTVRQVYDILGYTSTSISSYAPVGGGFIDMKVRAFYYGCIDARFYNPNSSQGPLRTFQLDKALVVFAQNDYLNFQRYGIGVVPQVPAPTPVNFAYSYVNVNEGCAFCSSSVLTAANAISIGIPASVEMVRQSP